MENVKKYLLIIAIIFFHANMIIAEVDTNKVSEMGNYGVIGGVVKPVCQAKLSFPQSGVLLKVPEEGQMIKKGWLIAQQDDRSARIALAESEAALESARLAIETAQHEKNKTERLLKERIVAPIALTEANFELKKAQAQLKIAKAGHVAAKLKLEQCKLVAPFKGVIVEVFGNIGEQSGPGSPVAKIVDISRLKISVDIPLNLSNNIKPGVQTAILSGNKIVGKAEVRVVLPLLDPASGLRRVIFRVIEANEMITGRHVSLAPWK